MTPTEISICNLVRNGMRTKEIAELRGISRATVNRHREKIVVSLKITNQDVNLAHFPAAPQMTCPSRNRYGSHEYFGDLERKYGVFDNPLAPICRACRDHIAGEGDATEIDWLPRSARYGEKLATPDITIADLIGDVDPIKVAEGRYLSDELTIHYGLIPRTNRGIFCINELPDLAERLQVGLFNLMEESDVQIRGYHLRLALDVLLVASANPEDYTSRGRIITPLKDRYGAQIRTHYPVTTKTRSPSWNKNGDGSPATKSRCSCPST